MKSAVEIDRSLNQTLTVLASACIHAALMVGICCSATEQKEKPIAVATKLIELKTMPLPEPPSPQPPKPEPPKPEPPKPEPPKPEPPKPEPPKPEPPKPQPPKPPEVKPQPPKPLEVKPSTPTVVKPDTKPVKKPSRMDEIREQIANGPVKKDDKPHPQPSHTPQPRPVKQDVGKSQKEYESKFTAGLSTNKGINLPVARATTTAEISDDYAEKYVRAILYNNWHPSRGGMKYAIPSPVDITFTVTPSGTPSNPRISKQSNDAAMNDSVRNLLSMLANGQIRFTPFAEANVTQPYLTVTVTMYLENK